MDFAAALAIHLGTIERRDLDGYIATIHDSVTVVLPNGRVLKGADEVAAFHRDWFAETAWRMATSIEQCYEVGGVGVALLAVEYHDVDDSGATYTRHNRLGMIFAGRDDGRWLLVYDQNTRC